MIGILLGNGFEEMEALCPCDCLRRAGLEVRLVSIDGADTVTGAHGITVRADCALDQVAEDQLELLILPGGLGGVHVMLGSPACLGLIKRTYDRGRYVAAICAAPIVLAALHITDGKQVTCYPGMEEMMGNAVLCYDRPVVWDGLVITSTAAGTAMEFALYLVGLLKGHETVQKLRESLSYRTR